MKYHPYPIKITIFIVQKKRITGKLHGKSQWEPLSLKRELALLELEY
jgi:hypothetical protein